MSREISVTLPDAWITEDGALFMAANRYVPVTRALEAGNKALEEGGYDERIGHNNFQPPYPKVWVDPAYVAAERWPESAVSDEQVDGWVSLFRVYVEDLESHGSGSGGDVS